MDPLWIALAGAVAALTWFVWRRTHPRPYAKLALREGRSSGLEFPLVARTVTVGSEESRDVTISDPRVSAFHATLTRGDDGRVRLQDRSRLGTRINGTPVTEDTALRSGDLIRLADSIDLMYTQLTGNRSQRGASRCPEGHEKEPGWERCPYCEAAREKAARVAAEAPGTARPVEKDAPPPEPGTGAVVVPRKEEEETRLAGWLVAVSGPQEGEDFRLCGGRNVIGKGGDANVLVKDAQVSERHALIEIYGGRLTVTDLGSKYGTERNGQKISAERPLLDGDVLRVGGTELKFRSFPG